MKRRCSFAAVTVALGTSLWLAVAAHAQSAYGGHSLLVPLQQHVKPGGNYGPLQIYLSLDGGKPVPIYIDTGSQQLNVNYSPSFWPGTPRSVLKNAVDMFGGFGNGKSGSIYRPVSSKIALYARPIGNSAPKLVYRIAQPVTVGKKLAAFDHRKYGAHASNCTFTRSPLGPNTWNFGLFGASALNGLPTPRRALSQYGVRCEEIVFRAL